MSRAGCLIKFQNVIVSPSKSFVCRPATALHCCIVNPVEFLSTIAVSSLLETTGTDDMDLLLQSHTRSFLLHQIK